MSIEQEQIQLIIDCQQKIIDNPVRGCVNSESSFVKDLIAQHDEKLAMIYWVWVCMNYTYKYHFSNNQTILENQQTLDNIDKKFVMPEWGYSGT